MKALLNWIAQSSIWHLFIQTCLWIGIFLQPIKTLMWVALFLIASDLVLGTWASVGVKREAFSSRAFWRTLGKIFIYEFLLVFGLVLQKYVWLEEPIVKGIITLISIVESISILENIKIITGVDVWAFVFHEINKNSNSGKFLFKLKNKTLKKSKKKS